MRKLQIIIFLFFAVFVQKCYFYENFDHIKIGALFDEPSEDTEIAFQYAVQAINNHRSNESDPMFEAVTARVEYGNQFEASKKLCKMLKTGIFAVLGPSSPEAAEHVANVCDSKEMPVIETRFDRYSKMPVVNLYPSPQVYANVFYDLVKAFEWSSFTILYENAPWLPILEDLLQSHESKGFPVIVRQIDINLGGNYRQIFSRIKKEETQNIILSCSIDILPEVLLQAQQVGILSEHQNYIITTPDLHTIDLEPYQFSGVNITGVRMVNPENPLVTQVTEFFEQMHNEKNAAVHRDDEQVPFSEGLTADKLRIDTALAYDAVLLFAETIRKQKEDHYQLKPMNLRCGDENSTWHSGMSISNFMRDMQLEGLTGHIKFDHQGQRSVFGLDIIELASDGIKQVGTWNSSIGLNISRNYVHVSLGSDNLSLQNKSFIVLTAISAPYGMLKENIQKLSGNDRFEGFGIELIDELSRMLGFNYTFKIQEDKIYGSLNSLTRQWNGMVLEIMEDRADLAITDLTITSERESAVDFTGPFMNLGISILFQKPTKESPSLFSFMSPFSNQVWMYLGTAFFLVSCSFFVMARLSPVEWDNPYPCIEEPDVLENQFSFRNSMWFTIGALLQQGSELAPKAPCTRIVASMWWFFTLIMVSSYTANLAAFLTIENVNQKFENVEQLANMNGKIPYGAKRDGSTINFFKDSDSPIYQKMYKWMMDHPQYLTSSNDEGVDRAKKEPYAFLMESSSIDFIVERECKVTRVGGLLDAKGYGIAMKKNSPYRSHLGEAVLKLQETGKLSQMQIKWWKEKRGGGACSGDGDEEGGAEDLKLQNVGGVFICLIAGGFAAIIIGIIDMTLTVKERAKELQNPPAEGASKLKFENVGGVFLVLGAGCFGATVIALVHFIYRVSKQAKDLQVPFKEEFMEELKFVVKLSGNTKIIKKRKSSSQGSMASSQHSRSRSRSQDF